MQADCCAPLDRAETLRQLEREGVTVEILRTPEAVATYNRLAEREPVGALIHSTC